MLTFIFITSDCANKIRLEEFRIWTIVLEENTSKNYYCFAIKCKNLTFMISIKTLFIQSFMNCVEDYDSFK